MIKLLELIKKNFKLLVRAKISALVIFIGPLLLVSLLGLAYSQSSGFDLTTSVFSDEYTVLSESLITKLENQNVNVLRGESTESCIASAKGGEAQACIIFPPGMDQDSDKSNEVTFYVDYSQLNLVWIILDMMSARVSERSDEISKELTSDLLSRMWFVEEKIKTGQSSASKVKQSASSTEDASGSMKTGFKGLDISVDFSDIDMDESTNMTAQATALLTKIKQSGAELIANTDSDFGSIESSVEAIEAEVNSSSVMSESDDIDDAASEIKDAMVEAIESIDADADNASAEIEKIQSAFDAINSKMTDTQSKISSVKKKRDSLLPEFERISSDIDTMQTEIENMNKELEAALQKILAVKGKNAENIVAPITTKIEPLTTQKTHFNSLFPTLLVLVIMITGVLLAATLVSVEKKSKAFFRNSFTPTTYFTFNAATYLTSLAVLLMQLLLFISVSTFFFKTDMLATLPIVLLIILLTATVFICIGMFIGYIFKTDETVNLAAITLIAVFLLFSSAVIPLESLPAYIKDIAMLSPFVVSEFTLRQTIIFQLGFSKIMESLSVLAGYALGMFLLLSITQNALRKLSFMHFEKLHFGKGKNIAKEKKASLAAKPAKTDINELAVKPATNTKKEPEEKTKKPFFARFLKK